MLIVAAIVINILIMLLVMLSLQDLRERIVAVGVGMMIISGILQQDKDEKESNESGQVG